MAAATPDSKDLIDQLAARLSAVFGLEECSTIDRLLGVKQPVAPADEPAAKPIPPVRFMRRPRVRVGGYFDLSVGLVVYDAAAGTLGLVEQVGGTGNELRAALHTAINAATSLRQLLIEQADRRPGDKPSTSPCLPLQVELLLLVDAAPEPAAGATQTVEHVLSDVLSEVAREGGYLRLIGVGILRPEGAETFSERSLRRAFPWLLTATTKWFARPEFVADTTSWRTAGESFELCLQDYRAAGRRQLHTTPGVSLQLLHGNNGTGKSSIAEALELLLTGRIERLEEGGESNYFLSVRYRPPGTDNAALQQLSNAGVSVTIGSGAEPVSAFSIGPGGRTRTGDEPTAKLHVNSFRLDQVFMDRLVRATPDRRATMFLNAFSPTEREAIDTQRTQRAEFTTALAALPQHARTSAPPEESAQLAWAQSRFGWLRAPDLNSRQAAAAAPAGSVDPATRKASLEALLPMPFDDLRIVSRRDEPLLNLISSLESAATRDAVSPLVGSLDEALPRLVESVKQSAGPLRIALRVLEEFRGWTALGQVPRGESFKADLDAYLEAQALVDLFEKRSQIVATIAAAEQLGWRADREDATLVGADGASAAFAADLDARRAAGKARLREAQSRMHLWLEPEKAAEVPGAAPQGAPIRRKLSKTEIESLNLAGTWLDTGKSPDPLGVTFDRVLADDKAEPLSGGTIGVAGRLDPVINEARDLLRAFERLQQVASPGAISVTEALSRLSKLVASAEALSTVSADPLGDLFRALARGDSEMLRHLVAAVNELLALMTPARWQYRDIQLDADIGDEGASVVLTTYEGARADLLFNTAEMNAFALTLFLLLAPRLDNSLRLIVLDDPLQNMDELTVITVARALSRLLRVYPRQWLLLALFHSEEDIARIQEETQAVRYSLPWVRSTLGNTVETIPAPTAVPVWPPSLDEIPASFVVALPKT